MASDEPAKITDFMKKRRLRKVSSGVISLDGICGLSLMACKVADGVGCRTQRLIPAKFPDARNQEPIIRRSANHYFAAGLFNAASSFVRISCGIAATYRSINVFFS